MKKYNFLFIILLAFTFINCGDTKKGENSLFTFDISSFKEQYQPQEAIELGILNPNSKTIDSIAY
jgi:glutaminyl-peptide cyclotransferase